ncbi:MAG: porin, partial [Gammaproteobacteria bacterium]|nr:porin [Gammaproteobacteria bacterium]
TVIAQTNEVATLKQQVKELQAQLKSMQQKLDSIDENVSQNAQAVEATAEAVESYSSVPSFWEKTSMGGYGELHYNNLSAEDEANDKEQIDFHRFVLFFGHEFSDRLRFFSEVELEHSLAGDDKPGEVELEQAFVEYDFNEYSTARAGVFLLPIGILNETHEPPTFYGVERNAVENVIIPTTWWAGGVGYTHRTDAGFSFDVALHEGLKIDGAKVVTEEPKIEGTQIVEPKRDVFETPKSVRIRDGRQKTAEADADDLAVTGRIKYTGMPGLELAASLQYQSDITQESGDAIDDALLYEAHVVYSSGPFGFRALYAGWDVDVDAEIDDPRNPGTKVPVVAKNYDSQHGWYAEPSYKVTPNFGIFARYEDIEGGRSRDEFEQWTVGFNYWLNENAVFKADFQDREHDNAGDQGRDYDGFNLGVGYEF